MNLIQPWSMDLRKSKPAPVVAKYTRSEPVAPKAPARPAPAPVYGTTDRRAVALRDRLWRAVRDADGPVWVNDIVGGGGAMRRLLAWAKSEPGWTVERRKRNPNATGTTSWCVVRKGLGA